MNHEEFLRKIAGIRVATRDGRRAPHKALLILLALGRLSQNKPRLASYEKDIRKPLRQLLEEFGPSTEPRPAYPFWRLRNDDLWEVSGADTLPTTSSDDVLSSALIETGACGGFLEPIQYLLQRDPELVETVVAHLLSRNFPDSLHLSIRDEVGLPAGLVLDQVPLLGSTSQRRWRDPSFRPSVLDAYEHQCAVCGFDVYLGEDLIGVDAAHIRWHQYDGPDSIANGLALCKLHHDALDRGAIGLFAATSDGFRLTVSNRIKGVSEAFRQLYGCQWSADSETGATTSNAMSAVRRLAF